MHGLNTALRCRYSDIGMGLSGERYPNPHGWGSHKNRFNLLSIPLVYFCPGKKRKDVGGTDYIFVTGHS
jgi:hypothetical protein